ncbi:MAG: tetratricopeptide repeat protein [Thermoguttaceae bacterium]
MPSPRQSLSVQFALACVVVLALCGAAVGLDTIRTHGTPSSLSGRITAMDAVNVELQQGSAATVKDVPVNLIQLIQYEGEPRDLRKAREHILEGRYAEAITALGRIKEEPSRPEIQQDIQFYKALVSAKLALAGSGKIVDAGRMMKAFVDANPKNYHYFQASEIVGDLLVASRHYAPASDYYARLAKSPWPEFKMRANVANGRSLLEQGKTAEALAAFEKVLDDRTDSPAAKRQHLAASVGKAAVLVATKKPDDAVKQVEELLKGADTDATSEDAPLVARAYNVLGAAHRQAGRDKEALLAFLHVDLLYSDVPESHAEALANLAELWDRSHRTERANRARQTLRERYKDSPWTKRVEK